MGYQGDDENPYDEVKKEKAILVLQAAARGSMARRQARAMRFDVVGAPRDYVCTHLTPAIYLLAVLPSSKRVDLLRCRRQSRRTRSRCVHTHSRRQPRQARRQHLRRQQRQRPAGRHRAAARTRLFCAQRRHQPRTPRASSSVTPRSPVPTSASPSRTLSAGGAKKSWFVGGGGSKRGLDVLLCLFTSESVCW